MTNCEATAMLWRVLLYVNNMALRQRTARYRQSYFDASIIVKSRRDSIDWNS
jgi:hypothetical protein